MASRPSSTPPRFFAGNNQGHQHAQGEGMFYFARAIPQGTPTTTAERPTTEEIRAPRPVLQSLQHDQMLSHRQRKEEQLQLKAKPMSPPTKQVMGTLTHVKASSYDVASTTKLQAAQLPITHAEGKVRLPPKRRSSAAIQWRCSPRMASERESLSMLMTSLNNSDPPNSMQQAASGGPNPNKYHFIADEELGLPMNAGDSSDAPYESTSEDDTSDNVLVGKSLGRSSSCPFLDVYETQVGAGDNPPDKVKKRTKTKNKVATRNEKLSDDVFDDEVLEFRRTTDPHNSYATDSEATEPTKSPSVSKLSLTSSRLTSSSDGDVENRAPKYGRRGKKKAPRKPDNLALLLGMERTLFAALNNAWLLALGGVGLMSVGNGDKRATWGGVVILMAGIISAMVAFIMHATRINQLANNRTSHYSHSFIWGSLVVFMTLSTLGLELYFGMMYPYLQREKEVTIVGGVDGL